ncbi:hypothetical protein [Ruminococcus albus]|uniref:Conserved domain protein n=1 Tax=Ruminococcus albus 8 TaxID=246199 RepID=E9SH58_RUMAL|nr:hypothetical protein [Ruminococcus albus]EGC01314.1 conserved domain protein [Ruminococcus albus 8]MCC3351045.1 hypothetical protein [Ruminococcus albus 8]
MPKSDPRPVIALGAAERNISKADVWGIGVMLTASNVVSSPFKIGRGFAPAVWSNPKFRAENRQKRWGKPTPYTDVFKNNHFARNHKQNNNIPTQSIGA